PPSNFGSGAICRRPVRRLPPAARRAINNAAVFPGHPTVISGLFQLAPGLRQPFAPLLAICGASPYVSRADGCESGFAAFGHPAAAQTPVPRRTDEWSLTVHPLDATASASGSANAL